MSPRSRTTTRGSRSGVVSRRRSSPHRTSRTRLQPYYDRWELVGREDVGILERQQRALGSVLYRPGRLSWRDDQVQALSRWVLDHLPDADHAPEVGV